MFHDNGMFYKGIDCCTSGFKLMKNPRCSDGSPPYHHAIAFRMFQNPLRFFKGIDITVRNDRNAHAGLDPGEVFVHRNVANIIHSSDMNLLASLEFAVEALRGGDWQRAIDNFQAALRAEPDNATFHSGLAYAYLRRGSDALAFRHFREALRIDPGLASAHEGIGEAYLAVGDVAKAREHLAVLEQLCPGRSCQEVVDLERAIAAAK